jgi:hypothetical protein
VFQSHHGQSQGGLRGLFRLVRYIDISNASSQQKTAEDNSCGRVQNNIQILLIKYREKNNGCQLVPACLSFRRSKMVKRITNSNAPTASASISK